ncbi:hypothetical protein SAMN02745216_00956 [Desulfatibacillum alkenivorans DSM 16219]|jgi:hypothetical protein|uniref:Uncharacterized protein n=1 Tax=Desulfatibacillum alkenivorans DSM 16219 TaxID=1121393 RepID=A0A1M6GB75_9BACT|nr:hypothetical protein [Desulfatibacillum alkenivorans]SHJ07142.1 hypothetical protein SAMN02745216_00956 [Desulfatibacillum alkenivorans DSM 16219]
MANLVMFGASIFAVLGIALFLFKKRSNRRGKQEGAEGCITVETETIVMLKTNRLSAVDPANDPAVFSIPDFAPGKYIVPYSAIQSNSEGPIYVDTGGIFFMDAQLLEPFLEWFHETADSLSYDIFSVSEKLNEFDDAFQTTTGFLFSEGIGTNFPGDGGYSLDLSKLRRE